MRKKLNLSTIEIVKKIIEKKEFSKLPIKDVELVYSQFEKREDLIPEEKIKFTRDLLRKMYTAFVSNKLLVIKDRDFNWFLQKHISTKERYESYSEVYSRCLKKFSKDKKEILTIIDFGCGINGFSYPFFNKIYPGVEYVGTEPVGQLCELQNNWFKKNKIKGSIKHISLFDLKSNKDLVNEQRGKKVLFFFKVLDSLEMLEKNYSKVVLKELIPLSDLAVVSWATKSLISKKEFKAKRTWLKKFIADNFNIVDEFEIGSENYLVFNKK